MAIIGKKYQKKPTVVGVTEITTSSAGSYGLLGNLVSGDVILTMADGALHTTTASLISLNWDLANDNTTLTGTDWN